MKTPLQNKQLAFLEDTIKHFNSNNRAVLPSGTCIYSGAGCAIGRHVPDKELCKAMDEKQYGGQTGLGDNLPLFNALPPDLRELGHEFLSMIQMLHDMEEFWDEKGLTEIGRIQVKFIKSKFDLYEDFT